MPVLALFALSGCYLIHWPGGDPPPARDAGRPTPRPDAGFVPPPPDLDAGPVPSTCVLTPAHFACTDTGTGFVPVGVPYDLPIYLGEGACYCGETLRCSAELAPDGVLELTTHRCGEDVCGACFPTLEGVCPLPPLPEGRHRVVVNGSLVFEIEASNATPGVGPVDHCLTRPQDPIGCGWVWGPVEEETDQICHPAEVTAGEPTFVAITDFCARCGEIAGPCLVTRTASFIEVHPTSLFSMCDVDCPELCGFAESTCVIPPLDPGEYTVTLAGLPGSTTLNVLAPGASPAPGTACNSLPDG